VPTAKSCLMGIQFSSVGTRFILSGTGSRLRKIYKLVRSSADEFPCFSLLPRSRTQLLHDEFGTKSTMRPHCRSVGVSSFRISIASDHGSTGEKDLLACPSSSRNSARLNRHLRDSAHSPRFSSMRVSNLVCFTRHMVNHNCACF
jgi:hypothetical protein